MFTAVDAEQKRRCESSRETNRLQFRGRTPRACVRECITGSCEIAIHQVRLSFLDLKIDPESGKLSFEDRKLLGRKVDRFLNTLKYGDLAFHARDRVA